MSLQLCGFLVAQRYRRLGGIDPEGEAFLQVEPDTGCRMFEVADREILADAQLEITATQAQYQRPVGGRRPDDGAIEQAANMLDNRIAGVPRLG